MTFNWLDTGCLKQTEHAGITVTSQAGDCCFTMPDWELNYSVFSYSVFHDVKSKKSAAYKAEAPQCHQNNCAFISPVICDNSKAKTTATIQAGTQHE